MFASVDNFAAAVELILGVCIKHRVEPEDVPDMIVRNDERDDHVHVQAGSEEASPTECRPEVQSFAKPEPRVVLPKTCRSPWGQ